LHPTAALLLIGGKPPMSTLFDPVRLGDLVLPNRIVMAPMTRTRATADGVPTPLMAEHFAQRASAGLLVTDCTRVSERSHAIVRGPGIHTAEQRGGWQRVTDAVHAADGRIFLQIWHSGRIGHPDLLGGERPVGPSARAASGRIFTPRGYQDLPVPVTLSEQGVADVVAEFEQGARHALAAGFDGVELHGAFGYLVDQFLQSVSNTRSDAYGGTVERRCRFLFDVIDALCKVFGPARVGVKLSPANTMYGMGSDDAVETFRAAISGLCRRGIAYICLMEPTAGDLASGKPLPRDLARSFRHAVEGSTLLMANGGLDKASAQSLLAQGIADLVAFGQAFIGNPDLVSRLRHGQPLVEVGRDVWYGEGPQGYTDFPNASLLTPA
jgi:N-ethylmaleimide reductase